MVWRCTRSQGGCARGIIATMYPILFSLGPVHIFSFSVFLLLSWVVFSFLFWRWLHTWGVEDEKIFDLTFYTTLSALVGARALYVALHWSAFADSVLKIPALWVAPGLSLYGALIGGLVTLIYLARHRGVRVGMVVDAIGMSLPAVLILGEIGSLLDGSETGTMAGNLAWSVGYVGHVGRRHPVQLYAMIVLLILLVAVWFWERRATREKWPYGLVGVWFFLFFAPAMFLVELVKESSVYWFSISVNQWLLIGIFAEAVGAYYVRGGGREAIRPMIRKSMQAVSDRTRALYAKFSKRHPR